MIRVIALLIYDAREETSLSVALFAVLAWFIFPFVALFLAFGGGWRLWSGLILMGGWLIGTLLLLCGVGL